MGDSGMDGGREPRRFGVESLLALVPNQRNPVHSFVTCTFVPQRVMAVYCLRVGLLLLGGLRAALVHHTWAPKRCVFSHREPRRTDERTTRRQKSVRWEVAVSYHGSFMDDFRSFSRGWKLPHGTAGGLVVLSAHTSQRTRTIRRVAVIMEMTLFGKG